MSEVIENYIRRHPDLGEKEAFEGFLNEERIRAWVGTDESRRERLRKEFGRTWGSMHVEGQMTQNSARAGPAGPSTAAPRTLRVEVEEPPAPAATLAPAGPGARKLSVLCTNCRHLDVWMQGELIQCRRCHHTFDDMLSLIRVTPVGPFEFVFGQGWTGVATGAGIAGGLVALYLLLRWI